MTDPSIADPPSLYSPALIAKPAPPVAGPAAARTKLLRCGDWAATSAKTLVSQRLRMQCLRTIVPRTILIGQNQNLFWQDCFLASLQCCCGV